MSGVTCTLLYPPPWSLDPHSTSGVPRRRTHLHGGRHDHPGSAVRRRGEQHRSGQCGRAGRPHESVLWPPWLELFLCPGCGLHRRHHPHRLWLSPRRHHRATEVCTAHPCLTRNGAEFPPWSSWKSSPGWLVLICLIASNASARCHLAIVGRYCVCRAASLRARAIVVPPFLLVDPIFSQTNLLPVHFSQFFPPLSPSLSSSPSSSLPRPSSAHNFSLAMVQNARMHRLCA